MKFSWKKAGQFILLYFSNAVLLRIFMTIGLGGFVENLARDDYDVVPGFFVTTLLVLFAIGIFWLMKRDSLKLKSLLQLQAGLVFLLVAALLISPLRYLILGTLIFTVFLV